MRQKSDDYESFEFEGLQQMETNFKQRIQVAWEESKKSHYAAIENEFRQEVKLGHMKKAWDMMKEGIAQTKLKESSQPLVKDAKGQKAPDTWTSAQNWKAFWSQLGVYNRADADYDVEFMEEIEKQRQTSKKNLGDVHELCTTAAKRWANRCADRIASGGNVWNLSTSACNVIRLLTQRLYFP